MYIFFVSYIVECLYVFFYQDMYDWWWVSELSWLYIFPNERPWEGLGAEAPGSESSDPKKVYLMESIYIWNHRGKGYSRKQVK